MAKVKPNFRSKRGSTKRVPAKIIVHRTADRGAVAFEACVRIGGSAARVSTLKRSSAMECAYGKNPRRAIANAMKQVAANLSKRSGAFAGARKRRRR